MYTLAKSAVVLVPKSDVTKILAQEAASQLTSISRAVETYRAEMDRLAAMLPEYPCIQYVPAMLYAKVREYLATLENLPPMGMDSTGLQESNCRYSSYIFKPPQSAGFFVLPF